MHDEERREGSNEAKRAILWEFLGVGMLDLSSMLGRGGLGGGSGMALGGGLGGSGNGIGGHLMGIQGGNRLNNSNDGSANSNSYINSIGSGNMRLLGRGRLVGT